MLEINGFDKTLGNKLVLKDISLHIEQGSITGLIGINGAGKTTLLRCIAGVYKGDSGICQYNGQDIYENELIKKDILFLSDDLYYENDATIASLIEFYEIFYDCFDKEKFQEYMDVLKLNQNELIRKFSKGMKKQAFICLQLALCPKVLLLDESFDGLDPVMKSIIKKAITDLVMDYQSIVFISSHSLSDIEKIADHYVVLDNQTIVSHEDVEESLESYHRIQMAFASPVCEDLFIDLNVVECSINGQIVTLVVQGNLEEIERKIETYQPLMSKVMDLLLEEIFVSKMAK